MKKLFLITILLLILQSLVFAANTMPTESWSFTTIKDIVAPYITEKIPLPNAINIPRTAKVSCHIKDDGAGVDINTIVMKVNGIIVTPTITGNKYDYLVEYTSITPFDYGQIVITTVIANDLAN